MNQLTPLPEDVAELLREEADAPPAPSAEREHVLERLGTTLGEKMDSDASADTTPSANAPEATPGTPTTAGASLSAGAKSAALLLTAYAAGVATGVGVHSSFMADEVPNGVEQPLPASTEQRPVHNEPPAEPTIDETEDETEAAPAADPTPTAPTPATAPRRMRRRRVDGELPLRPSNAERLLIEQARQGLARGSATDALDTLREHQQNHPSGRYAEEREALIIQALVAAGRVDEARRRWRRFQTAYPASLFRPVLERVVPDDEASGSTEGAAP